MTTAVFHAHTERQRFAQLALAALGHLLAPSRRSSARRDELAAADDASQVRELAYRYAKTDPGFAADLYAAAARHEGLRE